MRFARTAVVSLLASTALVTGSLTNQASASDHIVAYDMVGSSSQNLISFASDAPLFSSAGDGFGKYQRGVTFPIPFALLDDSAATFPPDSLGVIDDFNLDEFFGATDTVNGDNGNTATPYSATWVFDISGTSGLGLSVDLGAMGDFESSDVFSFAASIDGGAATTLITPTVDESTSQSYTLAGGATFDLDDPLTVDGTSLTNVLTTFTAPIPGAGSELTVTFTGTTDGGSEAFVFQNLVVTGDDGGGPTGPAAGDLVITEVMQNPNAVSDSVGEWFEVLNTTSSPIELQGLTFSDRDSDSFTVETSVLVAAGGYAVLGNNADPAINGGVAVDYAYSSWFLSNGADEIVIDADGATLDVIEYDGGSTWPDPTGASMNLDPAATDAVSNDDGANWCEATTSYGAGDLGTPGAANTDCTPVGPTIAKIWEVQGSGDSVALTGDVEVQGIVTSLFTRDDVLDGFFLQEEDADADGDAATSDGIFVFCRSVCPDVAPGDLATVIGGATEFFGMSQIDATGGSITIDSSGNALPTPVDVVLPASGSSFDEGTYESIEGMHVTFTDTLVVSEYFELARYGQIVLTADARPYQFTHMNEPSVEGYAAFLDELATQRVILDDDNNDQNDPISDGPDEAYYYPEGGLDIGNRFRGGDTIDGLSGVMHWSFAGQPGTDAWRIRPIPEVHDYQFTPVNPASPSPADVGGSMTVASFNVLNLFSTIDVTSSSNSGDCGPTGTADCRGADSTAELERQQAKIAAAIAEIDAAVVGLIELENDGDDRSAHDLVDVLNALGAGPYEVIETGFIGSDVIKVGLIYQPAVVTPIGDYAILDDSVDPTFVDAENRPALIQSFVENSSAGIVTVAVNHLKSKGSGCDDLGDPDRNDGQASCPGTRTSAAIALADFLETDPTNVGDSDTLILGDLNSYAMEDPIVALEDRGYTDLLETYVGADAYTYVFDGQLGYLDYALADSDLLGQITGATGWDINADEIPIFDYNDDIRDPGESSFERESSVGNLYESDPLRSSDHDPVIVGTALDGDVEAILDFVAASIDDLADAGALNTGQERALLGKIDQALRQIDRGRTGGALGVLNGVAEQLADFVDDGILTADQADPLIELVQLVRGALA